LALEPDRCFGLVLAREDSGSRWRSKDYDNSDATQSLSFGEVVVAPAPGLVVAAAGDEPDRSFQHRIEGGTERGNHLVIEVAPDEFCVLAHLQQGSLQVAVGDRVQTGQILARVGSSGRGVPLTEPHLDMHLSNRPGVGQGEGIPFYFHGYLGPDGPVERGIPAGGLGYQGQLDGDLVGGIPDQKTAPE
jgi:hypothetical protein